MSRSSRRLEPGDPVFHPRFGLGTIQGVVCRERIDPVHSHAAGPGRDGTEEYYEIGLIEGGTLQVPVVRADSLGLRRASNGLETIRACLCSDANDLPANARERAALLKSREQSFEPEALAKSVRDMLAQCQGRTLSTSERTWLEKACQRLSAEVALVDQISPARARSAVWEVVTQVRDAQSKVL